MNSSSKDELFFCIFVLEIFCFMQELTQADFEKYGLEKSINVSWLNNKNIRLYYIDQDNTCTCIVKINDEIMLQMLKNTFKTTYFIHISAPRLMYN